MIILKIKLVNPLKLLYQNITQNYRLTRIKDRNLYESITQSVNIKLYKIYWKNKNTPLRDKTPNLKFGIAKV